MSEAPIQLAPGKSDADKATAYKESVRPLLMQVAKLVEEARKDGMVITFGMGQDQFGREAITYLNVVKPL